MRCIYILEDEATDGAGYNTRSEAGSSSDSSSSDDETDPAAKEKNMGILLFELAK